MGERDEFFKCFSRKLRGIFAGMKAEKSDIQEIRLRAEKPLVILITGEEFFVTEQGELTKEEDRAWNVTRREICETMEYLANYSIYAYEDELRQGFLTIDGGHRVGVAGKAVIEKGHVRTMKHISFLNVRISHEVKGCADAIMPYVTEERQICHTLIISPPGCGKTTLLRDFIRQASNGGRYSSGCTVGVVDERSEIGGSYLGVLQNDLGIRTDVLDGCPKAEGMMMMIRSMSPKVLAVDEIGSAEDIHALEAAVSCGCRIIATAHGNGMEDILRRPLLGGLVKMGIFERYITLHNLGGVGRIKQICKEDGEELGGRW